MQRGAAVQWVGAVPRGVALMHKAVGFILSESIGVGGYYDLVRLTRMCVRLTVSMTFKFNNL